MNTIQESLKYSFIQYADRVAITCEDNNVTFSDLNDSSNYITEYLLESGFNKGDLIGVLADRKENSISIILGILKAGCIFVPLDSNLPIERIKDLINCIDLSLIITDEDFETKSSLKFVEIKSLVNTIKYNVELKDKNRLKKDSCKNNVEYEDNDPVYIYFTSGTSGKPKAFLGKNKSLLHFIKWEINEFKIDKDYRISQLTSIGFDAFLRDMFLPLMVGGTIVILKTKDTLLDCFSLINWIEKYAIKLIHCVPSVFKIISLGNLEKTYFKSLKLILMAGEEIHPESLRYWFSTYGRKVQLINMYGTSETTMAKTFYYINESDLEKNKIPAGKAIPGSQVLVLDKFMKPCPKLVEGEIYIRTPYRTYGYCNMIDKTDNIFIKNPFNSDPDDILHKTGDTGKLLMDSNIEYIGRNDDFVKIRGNRVSLGEIENCLLKLNEIKDVVVMTKLDSENNNYLIGYIIPVDKYNSKQYRNYLLKKLPEYMIPNNWVEMETFPLTHNGKVNLEAFPDETYILTTEYIAPRNKLEILVLDIWVELLDIEKDKISVKEDFFLMGGNSLKLVNLISKLHKLTNVRIPIGIIFNNPTIEYIASFIKENERESFNDISKVEKKEYYSLSSEQKRFYLLQQLDLSSTVYNMPSVVSLGLGLDKKRVEAALYELIIRHESLRTCFEIVGENPVQRITQTPDFELKEISILKSEKQKVYEEFIRPFNLSQAPLFRVILVKVTDDSDFLMIDLHHIISDGVSQRIWEEEFKQKITGEKLPPLKLQYNDYCEWQRYYKQLTRIKEQKSYWLKKFEGEIPVLDLPTDFPRPSMMSFEGATINFVLSKSETQNIKLLAKENGLTLYMSVLSLFTILLSKLTNQKDIIIGTPVAGRNHSDVESIFGLFVNTLVMYNTVNEKENLKDFLARLKDSTLKDFENQEYLFKDLVENLSVKRDTGRNPIFDVMFNLLNQSEYKGDLSQFRENDFIHSSRISKFDLTLKALDFGEQLLLICEYSTKLFKPTTIERYIKCFKKLISQLPEKKENSISEIEIIPDEEKHKILFELNNTKAEYPKDKTIYQLFEEQVERTPENIAVSTREKSINYIELQVISEKLAKIILSKGLLPMSIVGLIVDRSIEMIIGLMGILKAGCCYLPIMPSMPKSRIEYLIDDSECDLILTQTKYEEELINTVNRINLEDLESIACPQIELEFATSPNNLAYIIYTSGTTGKPKGVMIENHSVINRIMWMQKDYPIEPGDVIMQKTSYTFDVSVWELFWWSFKGASVFMLEPDGEKDPELIAKTIGEQKINVMHFVPSMLDVLLSVIGDNSRRYNFSSLKYVFSSGEALKPHQVEGFYDLFIDNTNTKLVNLYGPTEATVDVSVYECLRHTVYENIPIGRPIDNTQLYVLDNKSLNIQPIGVVGELMISGVGLSRGYLKQEELTSEKFISHPFIEGERLYRTGDLARWLSDGNIEYLGRIDHQVKIRGFRIELGEIESILNKLDGIKDVIVIDRENKNEDKYLCAYVVSREGFNQKEIRNYLTQQLPDYMIPSYFVELEKIPLTANGKIDRNSLPEPEVKASDDYAAPSDKTEEKLVEIWSEVLNIVKEEISTTANFFSIGGHSLNATLLTARISHEFNVEFSLAEVFKSSTIMAQSEFIIQSNQVVDYKIQPIEKKDYYPLSKAQKRIYAMHRLSEEGVAYNINGAIKIEGKVDIDLLEEVIRKLIERHDSFRTSFKIINSDVVQCVRYEFDFELKVIEIEENEVDLYLKEAVNPFDLAIDELIRVKLFYLNENDSILFFDLHHIISDGVSFGVIVRDFIDLYSGKKLGALKIQYKDYLNWEKSFIQSDKYIRQDLYWKNILKNELPNIQLPYDFPEEKRGVGEAESFYFFINEAITSEINRINKENESTLFMFLLSAFYIMLWRITGETKLGVGSPVSGRRNADIEKVVGFFINIMYLTYEVDSDITFIRHLLNVKKKVIEAVDNQDYQISDLLQDANIKRDKGRNSLYEIVFALENTYVPEFKLSDLLVSPIGIENSNTKTDFRLGGREQDGRVEMTITYSKALFRKETIELISKQYQNILNIIIENPDVNLKNIFLQTEYKVLETIAQSDRNMDF